MAYITSIKKRFVLRGSVDHYIEPSEVKLLLAFMGKRHTTSDELKEVLWPNPDNEPPGGRKNVHIAIWKLRKSLSIADVPWQIVNEKRLGYTLKESHKSNT